MNIFASDLDQTLIYSKRWIKDKVDISCVEIYEDAPLSYMKIEAIKKLKIINKKNRFIPITTRTLKQYNRIDLPVEVETAVVANGGVIIENGKIDKVWQEIVTNRIKNSISLGEFMDMLEQLRDVSGVLKVREAQNLFAYIVVDESKFDQKEIQFLVEELDDLGWKYVDQGRKIYFLPKGISKGSALKYLKNKYEPKILIAAGDSKLDESMRESSDLFIIPGHSNVENGLKTRKQGITSSIEILEIVKNRLT